MQIIPKATEEQQLSALQESEIYRFHLAKHGIAAATYRKALAKSNSLDDLQKTLGIQLPLDSPDAVDNLNYDRSICTGKKFRE